MSFEATKREWSELYSFFRLLADGVVYAGTPEVKRNGERCLPIALIQREEHDGTRQYIVKESTISIQGENINKEISREDFRAVSALILAALKESSGESMFSPDGVEGFLDELSIYDLEAVTEDRTDFHIAFYHPDAPLVGFNVRSRLGFMLPLLDGGRSANLKYELQGVKFAVPTINKVNALDTANSVTDRMMLIERLGGVLKYADVADRVFRSNLLMIDLHFPRLLAEMLKLLHLEGVTKISELTAMMKAINPLKIKEELILKHGYYEYKVKKLLTNAAFGMRPAKIFDGTDSAVEGMILVDGSGELLCYQKSDKKTMEDFLFFNTRLERGSTEKDKYGYLEKENGVYYFKLNTKITFVKR